MRKMPLSLRVKIWWRRIRRDKHSVSLPRNRLVIGIGVGICVVVALILLWFFAVRGAIANMLVAKSTADYAKSGDVARALSLVGDALAIDPGNGVAERAAVELGMLQLQKLISQHADAAELQSAMQSTIARGLAAVAADPSDYRNWLVLSQLYQELASAGVAGAAANAASALDRAIADSPRDAALYAERAQLEIVQNDLSSAKTDLDQSLGLDPSLAAALLLRSQVSATQGATSSALVDAERVTTLAPSDPLGWYNLGALYYASASYAKSALALEKATTLQSGYADALYLLALTYDKLGRRQDALGALQQVAASNPGVPAITQGIADLKAGKPLNAAAFGRVSP